MPISELADTALPVQMTRLRRDTTGPLSALSTVALIEAARACDLEDPAGQECYAELLGEFYVRWERWFDSNIRKWQASLHLPGAEVFEQIKSELSVKLAKGALARITEARAWPKYFDTAVKYACLSVLRDRGTSPETSLERELEERPNWQPASPANQSHGEYEMIRREVLVESKYDPRPLQAVELVFCGHQVAEVARRVRMSERQTYRLLDLGSASFARAARKFGWNKLAAAAEALTTGRGRQR